MFGEDSGGQTASWLNLNMPGWKARAEARRVPELEAERVWGFEVGWWLAMEKCEAKASKPPSTVPTTSLSSIATQTDAPTSTVQTNSRVPQPTPPGSPAVVIQCNPVHTQDRIILGQIERLMKLTCVSRQIRS
jgi:hypothetical protein